MCPYPKKGEESEYFCDRSIHENIILLHDGAGGWYCPSCDDEDELICDKNDCDEICDIFCDACGICACINHNTLCRCGKYEYLD